MPVNQLTIAPVASGTEMEAAQEPKVEVFIEVSSSPPLERCQSTDSSASSVSSGTCKICHCGTDVGDELISPCLCSGSLLYVHQGCLQKWIKSTDARSCELCQYPYQIDSTLKPLVQWRPLELTHSEKRKLLCSIAFHIVAVTCILWSLWVLIDRTADEVKDGDLKWPFWTKLVVVAIGFVGGVVFMYVQCKVYVLLFHRLKAFNRLLFVRSVPLEVRGKLKSIQLEEEAAKNTS